MTAKGEMEAEGRNATHREIRIITHPNDPVRVGYNITNPFRVIIYMGGSPITRGWHPSLL